MKRRYEALLEEHFKNDDQMAFVAGPRQVGKTTTCTSFKADHHYFNWDNENDSRLFLEGPAAVAVPATQDLLDLLANVGHDISPASLE